MRNAHIIAIIEKEGMVLGGCYSEEVNGCCVTVRVRCLTKNGMSGKQLFNYTFWLYRLPNSKGQYDERVSCFQKEELT